MLRSRSTRAIVAVVSLVGSACGVARVEANEEQPSASARRSAEGVRAASDPVPALPSSAPAPAPAPAAVEDPDCPTGYGCELGAPLDPRDARDTSLLVRKAAHRLHLLVRGKIVRTYGVALGWGGLGQKVYEGDGTTPIGAYAITGEYPSKWHTYLAIDYPRPVDDERYAQAVKDGTAPAKRTAGSAIAIHGHRTDQRDGDHRRSDWTLGCVALDNGDIDEVAAMTEVGTRVVIDP